MLMSRTIELAVSLNEWTASAAMETLPVKKERSSFPEPSAVLPIMLSQHSIFT